MAMPIDQPLDESVALDPLDLELISKGRPKCKKFYRTKLLKPPKIMVAIKNLEYSSNNDLPKSFIRQYLQPCTHYPTESIYVDIGMDEFEEATKRGFTIEFECEELQIMKRLQHMNVVKLIHYFTTINMKHDLLLTLVMEYVPKNLHDVAKRHRKRSAGQPMSIILIKFYMYQLFRGLAYLHSLNVCHGNIKPSTILVNRKSGILKLAYFDRAKHLTQGQANENMKSPLHYRAPELILNSKYYTTKIDTWSAGCTLVYLWLSGNHFFQGADLIDQLGRIIEVLGTPSPQEIEEMNPRYRSCERNDVFPYVGAQPWDQVFRERPNAEFISLISNLLVYRPSARISALEACVQPFFLELKDSSIELPQSHYKLLSSFSELRVNACLQHDYYCRCILGQADETAPASSDGMSSSHKDNVQVF